MNQPKYPDITVQLDGQDGNGFAIVTRVRQALNRANVPQEEIKTFMNEALSDTYSHMLHTVTEWVEVE